MTSGEDRANIPFHHFLSFLTGILAVAAFLTGWVPLIWAAMGVGVALAVVPRLAGVGQGPGPARGPRLAASVAEGEAEDGPAPSLPSATLAASK